MSREPKILSPIELKLIAILSEGKNPTGREIAERYCFLTGEEISYGTLYTTMRRMCELKLVKKNRTDGSDERERIYSISVKGESILKKSREFYKDLANFLA